MSLCRLSDPRYIKPEHLSYLRNAALRKGTFTHERMLEVMDHAAFLEEHATKLAKTARDYRSELEQMEEFIGDRGLTDEWEYERDGGDDYEADPPLSASSCRLINRGGGCMSNDIPGMCADAARAWNKWLKADVPSGKLQDEAVGKTMKAAMACGMPLQAVLDRGNIELEAQQASEG